MWQDEESGIRLGAILCLGGMAVFLVLGVIALLLRLSLVEVLIFLSIGATFLIIFLYGWFVTREDAE